MKRSFWPYLLVVLALAGGLRLANLEHARFLWPDEYRSFDGVSVATPLFGALYSDPIAYFGQSHEVVFYTSGLFGVLGVLVTFLIGSRLRSNRVGCTAALLLAVCGMHVNFSRSGYPVAMQTVLIAWGLHLVLNTRSRSAHGLTGMLVAGTPFGLAQLCYLPSYASLAGAAAAIVLVGLGRKKWLNECVPGALLLGVGAVGAYLSGLFLLTILHPEKFESMAGYFGALRQFQRVTATYQSTSPMHTLSAAIEAIARGTGAVWLLTATIGFLGACYVATRPAEGEVRFLVSVVVLTFVFFTTAGIVGLHTVYDRHYVSVLPALCVLIAICVEHLLIRWRPAYVYTGLVVIAWFSSVSAYRVVASPFTITPITSYLREHGIEKAHVTTSLDLWEPGDTKPRDTDPGTVFQNPSGAPAINWKQIVLLYRDDGVRYLLTSGIGSRSQLGDGDPVLAREGVRPLHTWTHPYRMMGSSDQRLQDFSLYDLSEVIPSLPR